MHISEDHQPNETRLSRKGNDRVPIIRTNYPQSYKNALPYKRPFHGSHNNYPSKRPRIDEQSTSQPRRHATSSRRFADSCDGTTSSRHGSHQSRSTGKSIGVRGIGDAVHSASDQRANLLDPPLGLFSSRRDSKRIARSDKYDDRKANSVHRMSLFSKPEIRPPLHNSPPSVAPTYSTGVVPLERTPNHSITSPSEPVRSQNSPLHQVVSLPPGPPQFRSGKITMHSDGSAVLQYNTVPNLSSFWTVPPLWRPSAPVSASTIDLTPDNVDTLGLNGSVTSVSHLPSTKMGNDICPRSDSVDTSSGSSRARFSLGSILSGHFYNLPKQIYDKPRRLLVLHEDDNVVNISMRGFIDKIYLKQSRQRHPVRVPEEPSQEFVNDACIVTAFDSPLLVLGHARNEKQVSVFGSEKQSIRYIGSFSRQPRGNTNSAVSAMCTLLQPFMFATGGFDHAVHLWDVKEGSLPACGQPLAIKHTALIQSLLSIRDSSQKLLSAGADCNVNVYDLSSERVVTTMKASNSVYHIHRTPSPYCSLLQVGHREYQFELRDHRSVPQRSAQRFGFDSSNYKIGRYAKGDVSSSLFAYGDKDGRVRVWDLRHVSEPVINVAHLTSKIAHVIFYQSRLVAVSEDNHVAAFSYTQSN